MAMAARSSCRRFPLLRYAKNLARVHGSAKLEEIPVGTSPLQAYNQLVSDGSIRQDPAQIAALQPLERLYRELHTYKPSVNSMALKLLTTLKLREAPKGVYMYGGVGNGKSLVQDIFYQCIPVERKHRVHFHEFMLDIHKRLHDKTKRGEEGKGHVLERIAEDLLSKGWVFCFDEFQVTDIADAMILRKLLEYVLQVGGVVIATSNRAPSELYKNGPQRDLFLPCIRMIEERCEIHAFEPNTPDYRLISARPAGSSALSSVYHIPVSEESSRILDQAFKELAENRPVISTVIKEGNRAIYVPKAAGGVAYFTFHELCATYKGAADYLAIARSFHTVILKGVPQMTLAQSEMVRRFITLVDIFYEHRVKLILSADAKPNDLYCPRRLEIETDLSQEEDVEKDEEFAFVRTVSRLNHMQSVDYLAAPWVSPGKDFIGHLETNRLQEGDLCRIWDRYNKDHDNKLSRDELMLMMEDLTEIKSGHRYVPEELLDSMYRRLDENGDGNVSWEEFRNYFLQYGLEFQAS